jgi:hypothetical protein
MQDSRTWAVLLLAFGVGACSLITEPLPADAEPFVPPAVYARWWAMTEECSGLSGDFGDVAWYRVPGTQFMHGGREAGGSWTKFANRIVLAESNIENGDMVRHEMLHALRGLPGHPRSQFLEACASLVLCQGSCINDAGRWQLPHHDYAILPPESLEVSFRADVLPGESDGQRWFELEVSVRNPRGRAVLVAAPGDAVTPPSFGYDLRGPATGINPGGGVEGGDVVTDSSTLFFEPFETKQRLFEFQIKPEPYDFATAGLKEYHLSPGTYLVRGDYARERPPYATVEVSP